MRAYVFTGGALAKHAGRFVWLSIDTEKDQNAQFVEKFPIENWPTLLVLDASAETPVLKWAGSANVQQLEKLFDDADRALASGQGSDAEKSLATADRLNAERKYVEAAEQYAAALKASTPGWERRNRAVESLTIALYQAKKNTECADAAVREVPSMPRGPSFANATAMGLFCAMEDESAAGPAAVQKLRPYAEEALKLPGLLADDRSGLYDALVDLRKSAGDEAGSKALAAEWLGFLEQEAAKAPNVEARSAFDPHRVSAAIRAGHPERAIPALEQTERELPKDYNAPARLAILYRELGQFDASLAASDRALKLVYGPRTIGVYEQKALTLVKKGDKTAAKKSLEEAKRFAQSIAKPTPQVTHAIERLNKSIAELDRK